MRHEGSAYNAGQVTRLLFGSFGSVGLAAGTVIAGGGPEDVGTDALALDEIAGTAGAESTAGSLDTIPEGLRIQSYYPSNDGFVELPITKTLQPGELMDRYGLDSGRFASPHGTPTYMRSLPYGGSEAPFGTFRVLKPFDVQSGEVGPWFDQLGGGMQYRLPRSIQSLKDGFIERADGG